MHKKYFIIIQIVLCLASLLAQGQSVTSIDPSSRKSSLQLRRSGEETAGRNLSGTYYSINPDEYIIDSGDELFIKVDVPGPELKTYSVKVSSDGYLFIPDAPGIYIRGLILNDAKKLILAHLKKHFPNSEIEVYFDKIYFRRSGEETAGRNLSGTYYSINPDEYIIDSGDELFIKVDFPGPEFKTYSVKVSSDGYLFISDAPGIYIRGFSVNIAKKKVSTHLKKHFSNAVIEVYFDKIHPIQVYLTGALNRFDDVNLNSGNRLYDAIEPIISTYENDTLLIPQLQIASLRNVKLLRKTESLSCDILKFRVTGSAKENPYLMDNDIIHIPFKDTTGGLISIEGLVGKPITFEFKPGDKLQNAVDIAGGMLPSADSNHIMIYRFNRDRDDFRLITLQFPSEKEFQLIQDDRIYIRRKPLYHSRASVWVKGEVIYPGVYPIVDNQTTLSEIIDQAGGFTPYVNLKMSRVVREDSIPGEDDLERMIDAFPVGMTRIERNYWTSSTKGNLDVVSCEFSKLFNDKDIDQDIILRNDDIIEIGSDKRYIYVSGAIIRPGIIKFNPDWTYLDYIASADGFKERAKKKEVKLIKFDTENWLDADKGYAIDPGDRLFVPHKYEYDMSELALRALSIVSQVTTVLLVVKSFGL
ncbi:SLBB domain-containing protein [bacterium]|nr:SLBB domain-containing protein [bacterium]